jgi:hypothetical protein
MKEYTENEIKIMGVQASLGERRLTILLLRNLPANTSDLSAISSQQASDDNFMNIFYKVEKEISMNIKHIKRSCCHRNRG